ncbi:hypothetical protein AB835_09160 [Candidatus Endobugula sertula]|uniref:Uncharacterized protein n=1 Tax=Candidatus Endobugula sertula TaxID=62101 RepID=A0A1D2QP75_9GAMM|nr:hypothetical protein AB835_09160 [Candidatus Endobugula sertula]
MINKLFNRFNRLANELRLLGFKASYRRIIFEVRRRLGLDAIVKRPRQFSIKQYLRTSQSLPTETTEYIQYWRLHRTRLGLNKADDAQRLLLELIPTEHQEAISRRALEIHEGIYQQFSHNKQQYSSDNLWYQNPEDGIIWPQTHSSKILLHLRQYGDIKLVWEIGRFSWAMDLVRAWILDRNDTHIDLLFKLIQDFADNNPLYIGPQWTSEQEVGIRVLMLTFIQEVLAEEDVLTGERLQLLHALLELHGHYLEHDLNYAEIAIRNNHLIHGAIGLYAVSSVLLWHPKSTLWHQKAATVLQAAVEEQWYDDGGYVQPSHNYQRSAWHGMLWARMIAQPLGDTALVNAIHSKASASYRFFISQLNLTTGMLPNWGPNDGALIGLWTSCDYADYRPLIQTLGYLSNNTLPFTEGPWDEELFWFCGKDSLDANRYLFQHSELVNLNKQGLHILRPSPSTFAVLRCGSVSSRYGQQADQLHVDLWDSGNNIALDAGSYNYNKGIHIHNWFRGTASHNTVIIDELDQMIPHRTFKYLRWTKADYQVCNIKGVDHAILGVHHGYTRLEGCWGHARLLLYVNQSWIIIDRLWPMEPSDREVTLRLHWQLPPGNIQTGKEHVQLTIKEDSYYFSLICSLNHSYLSVVQGEDRKQNFDGWHSRYYNNREPIPAINLKAQAASECLYITVVGKEKAMIELIEDNKSVKINRDHTISLQVLFNTAPSLLEKLL